MGRSLGAKTGNSSRGASRREKRDLGTVEEGDDLKTGLIHFRLDSAILSKNYSFERGKIRLSGEPSASACWSLVPRKLYHIRIGMIYRQIGRDSSDRASTSNIVGRGIGPQEHQWVGDLFSKKERYGFEKDSGIMMSG